MKQIVTIILGVVGLFTTYSSTAQICPPTGFTDGSSLYFFYNTGTIACEDRPASIVVDASTFSLVDCGEAYSVYDLESGDPLLDLNFFEADFGVGLCEYTGGVLTGETLSDNMQELVLKGLSVYPNPVKKGQDININFASAVEGNIVLYDVTGKQIRTYNLAKVVEKRLNVGELMSGIYMLRINNGTASVTKKIVILN
ncbi:MAG: hypothetical protein BM564_05390 [Bacteroidetes bacterium MedPE-SWsnd-G2]|nr:MAG: hypothetical protein BM564_05390 [Bacteroidetes bacterium MedPE-SWsnd-G2]